MSWKERFKGMMVYLGWDLRYISKITGFKYSSLNSRIYQKDVSRWIKLVIYVHEAHLKRNEKRINNSK